MYKEFVHWQSLHKLSVVVTVMYKLSLYIDSHYTTLSLYIDSHYTTLSLYIVVTVNVQSHYTTVTVNVQHL